MKRVNFILLCACFLILAVCCKKKDNTCYECVMNAGQVDEVKATTCDQDTYEYYTSGQAGAYSCTKQ